MAAPFAKRLVLPATLAVSTFVSANACNGPLSEPDYCVDIEAESKCNAAEGCQWSDEFEHCINICSEIETQEECEALSRCVWYPDGDPFGDSGGSDTGGANDPACGEPFT